MRAVIQRVSRASVSIDGAVIASIGRGVCILAGVAQSDTAEDAFYLAKRIAELRIFPDETGRFNLSLSETNGEALVVSQFTLLADTKKGRRPSFLDAAPADKAEPLVDHLTKSLSDYGVPVQAGRFGANMLVEIHNDGPVTIILESNR